MQSKNAPKRLQTTGKAAESRIKTKISQQNRYRMGKMTLIIKDTKVIDIDQLKQLFPSNPFFRGKDEPDRNDPCPCGSGKKYKNCCGAARG